MKHRMRLKKIAFTSVVVLIMACVCLHSAWSLNETALFDSTLGRELLKRSKSADIKSWMDITKEPCNDFYSFACGKWHLINSARLFGDIATDKFHDMSKGLQYKVHKLLTEEKTGDAIEDKLRDFYKSCMITDVQDAAYIAALQSVYREFGEFSFFKMTSDNTTTTTTTTTSTDFTWWSTVARIIQIFGKPIIISVDILDDIKDKNHTMVYIGPPDFDMTQTAANIMHRLQEAKIHIYLRKYLGVPEDRAKEVAKNLMAFEHSLSRGATDIRSGKSVGDLLTLYNITDLKQQYSGLFDFEQFLKLALNTTELPAQVYVYDESYLKNLIDVFNTTAPDIVEDYIMWLLLEEYFLFAKVDSPDKWCAENAKKYFGKFIDHAVYQQYRSEDYEKEVFKLWHEIKATFRDSLKGDKYYWMSNATREHAILKLDKMNLTINSYEHENFEHYFKNLHMNASDYVGNIQAVLRHTETLRPNKLEKKPDGVDDAQVLSFTPAYNSFENAIKLPVALLQPYRIWHPLYPRAIKYATLGFLLAHEMIHGFDDEGRNYDADGNTNSWWDEKSSYEFESRRRCFQAQYHNYTYGGRRLPESISQPENIADNAAIKIAYMTYTRWLAEEKKTNYAIEANETFTNLPYNNRELFFISFAQLWCEDVQTLFRALLASSDIHAPSMYRIIGSLANFHDFSWIFKCDMRPDTPMNPSIKCELY